jgi:PAS domain S-box-containing protein
MAATPGIRLLQPVVPGRSRALVELAHAVAGIGFFDCDLLAGQGVWSEGDDGCETWVDRIRPEDRERVLLEIDEAIESHCEWVGEFGAVLPDGSVCRLAARGRAVYDELGTPLRFVGASVDVGERRAFERELATCQGRLDSLYRGTPIGIALAYVLDGCRVINDVNPAFCEMLGYSERELKGMPARMLYLSDAEYEAVGALYVTAAEGGTGSAECRFRRKDGGVIDVFVTVTSIDPDDLSAGMTVAAVDISEQKRSHEALRESEERFRRLAENAPDVIFRYRLRPEPAVEYVSPAALEIGGYAPEEFYADPSLCWRLVHPDDAAYLQEALRAQRPAAVVARWRRRDGRLIWAEVRAVPVFDDQGRLLAYEGVLRDVTEAATAREEREQSFELLRRAHAERSRLLDRLVHAQEEERRLIAQDIHDDSIQVLTALAIRLELLADEIADPALLGRLAEATQTTRSVITGLRGLLFELDPPVLRRAGLLAALEEQVELIRQQTGAAVTLAGTLAGEPPFETAATAYRIVQEALVNVRKHAHAEHVSVELDGAEDGLTVRVVDDGCGFEVAPAELGHLGLVSMQERAEMAAGWLQLDSAPAHGTMVEFYLPTRQSGAAPLESAA